MFPSTLARAAWVSLCLTACSTDHGPGTARLPAVTMGAPSAVAAAPRGEGPTPSLEAGASSVAPTADADASSSDDAGAAGSSSSSDDAGAEAPDAQVALIPGSLEVSWMHGAADCRQSTDPELQVHGYNSTTYILRQDKCRTFEAPFVYLLLGRERALLLDTGATPSAALRDAVAPLVGERALLVAHTHAHDDHVASDARFVGQASTTVVGTGLAAVRATFSLEPWPTASAELDLGARPLDVLAVPGHERTHIALYDRQTGLLFTGDTLYPGLLFIEDWAAYRQSVRRLADFVRSHEVSHVLGAHVEMSSSRGVSYPYGTTYQPDEHVLQLDAAHVLELDAALTALGASAPRQPVAHDDFVIYPQ